MPVTVDLRMRDLTTLQARFLDVDTGAELAVTSDSVRAAVFALTGPAPGGATMAIESVTTDHDTQIRYLFFTLSVPAIPGASYVWSTTGAISTSAGAFPAQAVTFTMPDTSRLKALRGFLPTGLNSGLPVLNALATALAYVDEQLASGGYETVGGQMRQATSTITATGSDLDRVASDYGIARRVAANDDATFRRFVQLMAVNRKAHLKVFADMLDLLVGPGWKIYEITPGEVTVEYPPGNTADAQGSLEDSTYVRPDATSPDYDATADYSGDYISQDASTTGLTTFATYSSPLAFGGGAFSADVALILEAIKAAGIRVITYQRPQ